MTTTVRERPRSRRRRVRERGSTAWIAAKLLLFAAALSLAAGMYTALQPLQNPGVQDCGTPLSFFVRNTENVIVHPGQPGEPANTLELASQPTCRDLATVEMKRAAVGIGAFFAFALAGVLIGLADDRIAYWRAPRYETLLRGMAREDRVRHGLVPNVDVGELGARLPPIESLDVLGIVALGVGGLVGVALLNPKDITSAAAARLSLPALLLALVLTAATFAASAVARRAVYPASNTWARSIEQAGASAWSGRLRPLLGSFGLDVHVLRRAGLRRRDAVLDVQVLQTISFTFHVVLLAVTALVVLRQPFATLRIEPPLMVATGALALILLNGLTRVGKVVRGLPVRPSWRAFGAIGRVAGTPARLAALFGGTLLVTAAYVLVLSVCVSMFGGSATAVELVFVYLAVVLAGAVATTPAGTGAYELTMALLLLVVGVEPGAAVCGTIAFRVITFWLPLLPGQLAARRLHAADVL